LAVVRIWVEIATSVAAMPDLRLDLFRPDWEIREAAGAGAPGLVPDALVQVRGVGDDETEPIRFAVEADLGTERPPVIRRKLQGYRSLALGDGLFGWTDFGIAAYLPGATEARRKRIEDLFAADWPGWFAVLGEGRDIAGFLREIASLPLRSPLRARGGEAP
ncbi:MAG: replication-relaxation family protein, partial [Candidatus Eisenbacteria bacterium]|nr:replication-relaxation family protein [Candidatus Eisenbacteria bacterium]